MRFKLTLLFAVILISPDASLGADHANAAHYTIQIASFPNPSQAQQVVSKLKSLGERPTTAVVELSGRGRWTRVFVGSFSSVLAARLYAERLLRRGVISEFLLRAAGDATLRQESKSLVKQSLRSAGSPASTLTSNLDFQPTNLTPGKASSLVSPVRAPAGRLESSRPRTASDLPPPKPQVDQRATASATLPVARKLSLSLAPSADTRLLPRRDPVRLAFSLITGSTLLGGSPQQPGGLWISGDTAEGLARLRWVAGPRDAKLVKLASDGRVSLDTFLLAKAARADEVSPIEGPLAVTDYIYSNEGLLLLVQLTQARHRYRLHIGGHAPTRGAAVQVSGGINLDNNFDSRINPRRRHGAKVDSERPPEGFDSLIALNPVARWVNQETNHLVPPGNITFHELAEAHAKLELGLDYLVSPAKPGAHAVALEREQRLKSQRPMSDVVVTTGSNRVLRSEEEVRQFFSQSLGSGHQR